MPWKKAIKTKAELYELGYKFIQYIPYSPGPATENFHLPSDLKAERKYRYNIKVIADTEV